MIGADCRHNAIFNQAFEVQGLILRPPRNQADCKIECATANCRKHVWINAFLNLESHARTGAPECDDGTWQQSHHNGRRSADANFAERCTTDGFDVIASMAQL